MLVKLAEMVPEVLPAIPALMVDFEWFDRVLGHASQGLVNPKALDNLFTVSMSRARVNFAKLQNNRNNQILFANILS